MENIRVFSAGVAGKIAKMTASRYEAAHPGSKCEIVVGGSTDGVRRVIAGENFDVMILADRRLKSFIFISVKAIVVGVLQEFLGKSRLDTVGKFHRHHGSVTARITIRVCVSELCSWRKEFFFPVF